MPVPQRPRPRPVPPPVGQVEPIVSVPPPVSPPEANPQPEVETSPAPPPPPPPVTPVPVLVHITRTFDTALENEAWEATCQALGYEPLILGVPDPVLIDVTHRHEESMRGLRKLAEADRFFPAKHGEVAELATEEIPAQSPAPEVR